MSVKIASVLDRVFVPTCERVVLFQDSRTSQRLGEAQ